ncbi:hypothetical protein GX48_02771 [Paracoccidioides brasiliensis]|nr:hypothetical protein GX48_02771 [Paracoccidioides brasiliensis]
MCVSAAYFFSRLRNLSPTLKLIAFGAALYLFYSTVNFFPARSVTPVPSSLSTLDEIDRLELVVASTKNDNTSWLYEYLPEFKKNIYVTDNPHAKLTVPENKGREAMVYLTYIIDHYDRLPKHLIFIHPERYQWHNDDPLFDNVPLLQNFQVSFLTKQGYLNLRCVWLVGCPEEIRPFIDPHINLGEIHTGTIYQASFEELFPGTPVPQRVGVSCCAQFGVTREQILKRPKEEYEHFRQWLLNTPLPDELSGRVFEYSWHVIFGRKAVYCPSARECYCKQYGLCNLRCRNVGTCEKRYIFPPFIGLPKGWPNSDWYGRPLHDEFPFWLPLPEGVEDKKEADNVFWRHWDNFDDWGWDD